MARPHGRSKWKPEGKELISLESIELFSALPVTFRKDGSVSELPHVHIYGVDVIHMDPRQWWMGCWSYLRGTNKVASLFVPPSAACPSSLPVL